MNKEKKDIVSGSNLKFYWHANETGPSRRSVDLADFLVTQSSTTFCTELHGVSLKWIVLKSYTEALHFYRNADDDDLADGYGFLMKSYNV